MLGRPNPVQLFCKPYELRMVFFLMVVEKKIQRKIIFLTQENCINSNFITNKQVVLKHNHVHSQLYCPQLFPYYSAELLSCHRDQKTPPPQT